MTRSSELLRRKKANDAVPIEDPKTPADKDTTLIIAEATRSHLALKNGITSLGRRTLTVRFPLDIIMRLEDASFAISAVLAPVQSASFKTHEFFAFMKDAYPLVRRVAYSDRRHVWESDVYEAKGTGLEDVVLICPTSLRDLAMALWPVSGSGAPHWKSMLTRG
jgi:hypothetical protein